MINKSLAVGIVFLFIVSSTTTMVTGYNVEIPCSEPLDDLTVIYSDDRDSNKASRHMGQFLINYDDAEPQEMAMFVESPQTVATAPMDSPWPMICHDLQHTGRSPYSTTSNPGTEKWRFKTENWVYDTPVIDGDGIIYVGSFSGYFYAIYPDGTQKWRSKLAGTLTHSSPSIAEDGTIYVGTDKLYAIYPDGTLRWSFDLGADTSISFSSPAISADGTIYIGTHIGQTSGGDIIAINPDGTERWRKLIANNWVYSSPSIAEDGTVYIGSSSIKMIDEGYSIPVGYIHAFGPIDSNEPPGPPSIIGATNGNVRGEYYYRFSTSDPDENPVSFYVDWGDGTITDWSGGGDEHHRMDECASGETVFIKHVYSRKGTYTIKAKARDGFGGESDWGTLEVSMPKNRLSNNPLFLQFMEKLLHHFPLLARILQPLKF